MHNPFLCANVNEEIRNFSYNLVEQLRVSPAVKRQIWQTLQIIKELNKVMEQPPKKIFVEMAREKAESKRMESRKSKLLDLYKACKNEERNWIDALGINLPTGLFPLNTYSGLFAYNINKAYHSAADALPYSQAHLSNLSQGS